MHVEKYAVRVRAYTEGFYSRSEAKERAFRLKYEHTLRVRENSRMLADALALTGTDACLAEIAALFHDLGRFRQYSEYRTFKDADSQNHALLGVEEILSHNMLEGLLGEDASLICRVVGAHNSLAIPSHHTRREKFFLKILRDADKLDIWRVFAEHYENRGGPRAESVGLGLADTPSYSEQALAALCEGRLIRLDRLTNLNDFKLLQVGWIYDCNFSQTAAAALDRGHLENLRNCLPADERIDAAISKARRYAEKFAASGEKP
jgi:putative nucleotidyltransferase with HDIG domain